MAKKNILMAFFLLGLMLKLNAQYKPSNEVGIAVSGPVIFNTDYGSRGDTKNSMVNTGFGIEAFYYINTLFSSKKKLQYIYIPEQKGNYFEEHLKTRVEFSFTKVDLQHYGKLIEPSKKSDFSTILRSMKGRTTVSSLGFQIEYFPLTNLSYFDRGEQKWAPFINAGFQVCYYTPKVYSTLGDFGTLKTTPTKYLHPTGNHYNGFLEKSDFTCGLTVGGGIRRSINSKSDLYFNLKGQFFTTDWLDGINQNRKIFTENKHKDSALWLNFGYVYHLGKK